MSRWLAPPVYIRDAYKTVLNVLYERGGFSNDNVDTVLGRYLNIPAKKPVRMNGLWSAIRAETTNLFRNIFIKPDDIGYLATIYPYRGLSDDEIDEVIFATLKKAKINPAGWFFESGAPLSMVNPDFLEAAYYLLNNVVVYITPMYLSCSAHSEIKYTLRYINDNFLATKTENEVSDVIVGSEKNSDDVTYTSCETINRIYRIGGESYENNFLRGTWVLRSPFYLLEGNAKNNPRYLNTVADCGEKRISFFDNTSVSVPPDAERFVDVEKYLSAGKHGENIYLFEKPGASRINDLFEFNTTKIAVSAANLPAVKYRDV